MPWPQMAWVLDKFFMAILYGLLTLFFVPPIIIWAITLLPLLPLLFPFLLLTSLLNFWTFCLLLSISFLVL